MRSDWVPLSAGSLVIGVMSLVFGTVLNPGDAGASMAETLRVLDEASARWLAMAVMYVLASFGITLGLPAVLTLFRRRGHRLGVLGVALFSVGAVGTCGYAMLMVFFRALVAADAVRPQALSAVASDAGFRILMMCWLGGFYGGVALLAVALLVSRATSRWVPALMVAFVVVVPFTDHLGRVTTAIQVMALAVALTGIAMAAVRDSMGA